jgi:enoyl-CoA hydratase/carnithine racemase
MARLSRFVGRGRVSKSWSAADDFTGELAKRRYGYVNRAIPDAELDAFIDRFAKRVAGFEKEAIVGTKAFVNDATLPPISELAPNMAAFRVRCSYRSPSSNHLSFPEGFADRYCRRARRGVRAKRLGRLKI